MLFEFDIQILDFALQIKEAHLPIEVLGKKFAGRMHRRWRKRDSKVPEEALTPGQEVPVRIEVAERS